MIFKNIEIRAIPTFEKAYCECGKSLKEVSNGLLSSAFYCPECENVYELKLVKVPSKKITKLYLEQCRKEAANVIPNTSPEHKNRRD